MVERIRTLLESRQLTPTQFADLIGVARPIVSHILSGRNKPSLEVVQRILAAMPELAMPWLLNGSGPMLGTSTMPAAVSGTSPAPAASPVAPASPVLESVDATHPSVNQLDANVSSIVTGPEKPSDIPGRRPIAKVFENARRSSQPMRFKPAAKPKRFNPNPVATARPIESPPPETTKPIEGAHEPNAASAAAGSLTTAPTATLAPLPTTDAAPNSAMAAALFAGAEKPIRRIVIFYRDGSFADYQPEQ